jgi:hypothetical protein
MSNDRTTRQSQQLRPQKRCRQEPNLASESSEHRVQGPERGQPELRPSPENVVTASDDSDDDSGQTEPTDTECEPGWEDRANM